MRIMMRQKLFIIALGLTTGFLCSCKEADDEEKTNLSSKDSISKVIKDAALVANNKDALQPAETNTLTSEPSEKINSLAELNRRLNKSASHFLIKTDRDTVIKCKEGTLISIPANAFLNVSNQNPVNGEVKIAVKEFYRISDMLIAGLTTSSNDQLLETRGMINIKVTSKENNDSCILKPGKNITIAMVNADSNNVERMQLFNGVRHNSNLNWLPRNGLPGLAQSWGPGRNNFSLNLFPFDEGLVFPDEIPKTKPAVINSKPENLQAEMQISIRDLVQQVGVVTKKANGYIDTSGNLHCYRIGYHLQQILFPRIYQPATEQNIKVNLAVDVKVSFKSNLNHDYFQKLFKMGKGNPDSLVTVTATLNPAVKMTSFDKIKISFKDALTVKEYQKNRKYRALLRQQYEKRLKQLRLDNENNLISSESNGTTNLQSAKNYLLLSTPELGWINCDRFYNNPVRVDYLVKMEEQASLLIVFNSMKSIMSCDKNGVFEKVPLNEKITILGLRTEKGKLMMAFHETTITEKPFERISFEPVTIKEYKSRLEKLNKM